MTVRELRGSADRLYEELLLPWMQSTKFRVICEATRHLADALTKYADYLDSSTARVNVLHSQMEAARSPGTEEHLAPWHALIHECVVTDWHFGMPALKAPLRVWNQARQCLHDRSTELFTIQSFLQLYGCTVWWLSFVWTLFTLSLWVKRGYVGPSMVPRSWDGAWGIFVFLNTFVFFSLARFGFSKKVRRETKKQQGSP